MKIDLPLVAVVCDDPYAVIGISLIVSDLCRVRHCRTDEEIGSGADYPSLILTVIEVPGLAHCGFGRQPTATPTAPGSPLVHIGMPESRTCNDGSILADCFATPRHPIQFRAAIEARLRMPPQPSGASLH